jgi:aspartyl-tRNA(Asn)/glutamyl-tRNA(Gln) amidotransferase subunit A
VAAVERAPSGWTVWDLAEAIRLRTLSPVEVTEAYLDRIAAHDRRLRAYITVDADGALDAARAREAEAAAGRWRGPMHGVPLAYKDLCAIPGLPTSCGTRTPDYFRGAPPCTAVQRLVAAGAITLGKLNMTELALGPFGDNAHHGDPQNPWRPGHASGGSSSGSGVAVAAGLAAGALGTDTGGSIRLPAACCGIVGLKPTYGRVSRSGVMPLSWSLDHLGPMTRTVRDCALLLQVIAGHDPLDGTASHRPVPDYLAGLDGTVAGLRAGVPENHFFDGLGPDVEAAVTEAIRAIEGLGVRLTRVRLPDPEVISRTVSTPISRTECSAIHARLLRERGDEVQPAVRARAEAGFAVSAVEYVDALRTRAHLAREVATSVFARVDVLLAPTIPEAAPPYAEAKAGTVEEVIARMGRFSRLTRAMNALGLPALSVPCRAAPDGRPVGLQIIGRPFDEVAVLRLGAAWESLRAEPVAGRFPDVAAAVPGR